MRVSCKLRFLSLLGKLYMRSKRFYIMIDNRNSYSVACKNVTVVFT